MLSTRAKEAIKTALAMTIAYGIALSMNWDKPMWAGFAVAFVSLSTSGQSLNKAALRVVGTLVGVVMALTFIALFIQDRWLFILFVSLWVALCTYLMAGSRYQYLWHVAGFVTVIIAFDSGADPLTAFNVAMLRGQETGLGILVYGLISVLLWPNDSRTDFETSVRELITAQHTLYRAYHDLMLNKPAHADVQQLRTTAIQSQMRFAELFSAARTDSYEIWELRRQWRAFQELTAELAEIMEHWRESFDELRTLDLHALLPNLEGFDAEIVRRFREIERMLAGEAPEHAPVRMELLLDHDRLASLSHFQKAAVAVTRSRAVRLERLTDELFACSADIRGYVRSGENGMQAGNATRVFVPDPERMLGAFHMFLVLWFAWLLTVYVEGVPGGGLLIMMATPIGMAMSTMPQVSTTKLFVPVFASVLFAGFIYVLLMPELSSFQGLGALLFAVTFAICYLFPEPRQGLARAFGLAMFVVVIGVSNQQTYSFIAWANTAMVFPLLFAILMLTAHIPWSPLPEHVFLRLMGRFFRSTEYLVSSLGRDPGRPRTAWQRWRLRYHARELATLPEKLEMWGKLIDRNAFPRTDPKQVQALVISLRALSWRIAGLTSARQLPQSEVLVQELTQDIRTWRQAIQALFRDWIAQPSVESEQALQERLSRKLSQLEERINECFESIGAARLSDEDYQNFYRLLGSFRGVSEAMIGYARVSNATDFNDWRETRFG